MHRLLLAMACLSLGACGPSATPPPTQAATTPTYEALQGRFWVAHAIGQAGDKRMAQRLEFVPDAVRRVVFDRDLSSSKGSKMVVPEIQLACSLAGSGGGFILLNIAGGQDVWRVQVVGPDEIRIGQTTFLRSDGTPPPNMTIQRR